MWNEYPPDTLPEGYVFKAEALMLPDIEEHVGNAPRGRRLVQLRWEGRPIVLQMEIRDTVAHLNVALTQMMNQRGQGRDFQVDAGEFAMIDFEQEYGVRSTGPSEIEIFVGQRRLRVWENGSWVQVSEKTANLFGMPSWSIYIYI
jgi:hypothetical protein